MAKLFDENFWSLKVDFLFKCARKPPKQFHKYTHYSFPLHLHYQSPQTCKIGGGNLSGLQQIAQRGLSRPPIVTAWWPALGESRGCLGTISGMFHVFRYRYTWVLRRVAPDFSGCDGRFRLTAFGFQIGMVEGEFLSNIWRENCYIIELKLCLVFCKKGSLAVTIGR